MKKLFTLVLVMFAFVTIHADVYYWVGNGGNWSDFTHHWATSPGGGTFHALAPTSSDTVYFDANSFSTTGQTVTIDQVAYCSDFDMSGVTNNPTIYMPQWGWYLDIYGSVIFSGNVTYNMKDMYLNGDGFIYCNSAYLGNSSELIFYSGYNILMDSLSVNYLYFYGGYADLSYVAMNVRSSFYIDGSASDVCDMTDARIYTRYFYYNGSALMNTGGSTIYMNGNNNSFEGGGGVYNNILVKGSTNIYGNNSFNQFKILPASTVIFEESTVQSVNEFIANGERNREITIRSYTEGVQASIWSMTAVALDYVMVKDIYADGMINFVATNSIDISNNDNWSFTPPDGSNYYWIGNGGNWSDISHWSSSSNGTPDVSEPPSKYDNVYFDNNSFSTSGQTVTIDDTAYCNNLDLSAVTNNPTLYVSSYSNQLLINGSFLMGSNATFNLQQVIFISTVKGNVVTSSGNFPGNNSEFWFNGEGSWSLTDSLSARYIYFYKGYLDLNGQAVNGGENGAAG